LRNAISDFVRQLAAKIHIDEKLIIKKDGRYFFISSSLHTLTHPDFFFAGNYLGKDHSGRFLPSFSLLKMIARGEARKIVVDERTEWLFICGRDIFRGGIKNVHGSVKEGDLVLVTNSYDECLGFGRALEDLEEPTREVAVKNISDIGDFLRRERQAH
jgi:ribosome biogenesis protein Nip4